MITILHLDDDVRIEIGLEPEPPITPAVQALIASDELRARAEANNPEWFRGSMRSPFFERKHDEY